jgi:hypothetical protein
MAALISRGQRRKSERGVVLLGVDLQDAREEVFVRLVCDGIALGVAFARAGFKSKNTNAPYNLFHLPRVQERASAILEARRTTGVVSLSEVTDMLKRVFANAYNDAEYSAAHNAAFSLARLYGHVTDKATLEVIRRPSRDPDAPSEQALASWVEALPAGPAGPEALGGQASFLRLADAPAPLLGPNANQNQTQNPSNINALAGPGPSEPRPELELSLHEGPELFNDINWLEGDGIGVAGRPENGAPVGPVTVTPIQRGHSDPLGTGAHTPTPHRGDKKKGPPVENEGTGYPSAEDLF